MLETKKTKLLILKRIFPVVCFAIYSLTTFLKEEKGFSRIKKD